MELCKKEIKIFLYQSFPILARHPILRKVVCFLLDFALERKQISHGIFEDTEASREF